MAETKYNLLTRLLKDLRNQVSSSGDIGGKSDGGSVMLVHEVTELGEVLLTGTLPNLSGYAWRETKTSNKEMYIIDVAADLDDVDIDKAVVIINDGHYSIRIDNNGDIKRLNYDTGVLSILVYWTGDSKGYDLFYSESEVTGLVMTVYASLDTRLDKTYKEITDAGFCVLELLDIGHHHIAPMNGFEFDEVKGGVVEFNMGLATLEYTCSTENDYPERSRSQSGHVQK